MVFLKAIKKVNLIINISYIIVGFYLLILGLKASEIVFNILALCFFIAGIFTIIRYFLLKLNERYKRNDFNLGVIVLMAGIALYFIKLEIISSIHFIIGLLIILSGLFLIQDALDGKAIGIKSITIYLSLLIIEIFLGIIIILNPINDILFILMGIGMIVCGISGLVSNFVLAINKAKFEKNNNETKEVIEEEKEDEDILI